MEPLLLSIFILLVIIAILLAKIMNNLSKQRVTEEDKYIEECTPSPQDEISKAIDRAIRDRVNFQIEFIDQDGKKYSELVEPVSLKQTPKGTLFRALTRKSKKKRDILFSQIVSVHIMGEDKIMKPDLLLQLRFSGIKYIDKRVKNGAIWIIGGKELSGFVKDCKSIGVYFKYKKGGGKATKHQDAWWAK